MNETHQAGHLQGASFVKRAARKIVVLSVIFLAGLMVLSMTASRPSHLGLHGGKLAAVPDSPNCVSSMTEKESYAIDAIDVSGIDQPIAKLKQAIESSIPRSILVTEEGSYLHFEFTSLIFRFVDDCEFLLDEEQNLFHIRSASRVGYSDMGANRKRVEKIRAAIK